MLSPVPLANSDREPLAKMMPPALRIFPHGRVLGRSWYFSGPISGLW
jgi:hypothetical protein